MFKFIINICTATKIVGKVIYCGDLLGLAARVKKYRDKGYEVTSFVMDAKQTNFGEAAA